MAFSTPANWSIDQVSDTVKNIRYIGAAHGAAGSSYDTVIDFHRWLQELADDALASGDDELDITDTNPSSRSTDNIITLINGYNIDDLASEHLYDGSIIQDGGETVYDGIVNFGNSNVQVQVIQDGSVITNDFWNYNEKGTATGGTNATIVDTGATWTADQWVGYTIVNTTQGGRGIVTTNTTDTLTVNIYSDSTGALVTNATSDAYSIGDPLNANAAAGISHRFMLKTRYNNVDIDGRRLLGTARRYGNTFSQFQINGTARGNNVLALVDSADLNNATDPATVASLTVTNTEGLNSIDVDNNGTPEQYYSQWDFDFVTPGDINDLYEYAKFLTRDSSGETLYTLSGEEFRGATGSITYGSETGGIALTTNDKVAYGTAIVYSGGTGTFNVGGAIVDDAGAWRGRIVAVDDNTGTGTLIVRVEFGVVTDTETFTSYDLTGASAGTGTVNGTPSVVSSGGLLHLLAVDDQGTTGTLYFQQINGTAPGTATLLYEATTPATIDVGLYVTTDSSTISRSASAPFIGQSTGSALIGAYGIGVATTDLTNSDLLTALDGDTYQPPNNVTNTVAGIIHGEDYVIVAPWDGATTDVNGDPAFNKNQLQLGTTLTTDPGVDFTVSIQAGGDEGTPIPSDTPNSGTIRVTDDSGFERRLVYSSYTGSDFTINYTQTETDVPGAADFSTTNATLGNDLYITYLDELASGATVTAGSFVTATATQYIILTTGTTDFTLIGAANSTPGTVFTATGAGTGTGTAARYVTSESYTAVYSTDRDLVAVVRDGGSTPIIQFIAQWSFGSSGQTLTAIRTSDA